MSRKRSTTRATTSLLVVALLATAACTKEAPTPRASASPGVGTSSVGDRAGDLVDVDDKIPPRPQRAVDLTKVNVTLTPTSLIVGFDLMASPPKDSGPGEVENGKDQLRWVIEFYDAHTEFSQLYHIHTSLTGAKWEVRLIPWRNNEPQRKFTDGLRIKQRRIEIEIPRSAVPLLPNTFDWQAVTYWMFTNVPGSVAAGRDRAPDKGHALFVART